MSLTLDDTLTESLTAFARRTRSTQFSVLLAVMKVMIAAATSEGTTVLGMATSGRTPEFERTVGLLANTIVIRSEIDLTQSFAETLGEVSLDLMEAIDHQDLPFSRMIADLDAEQQLGSDILRTVFTAGAVGSLKLGEGDLSEVFARTDQGPFDLHVACDIVDTGIALDWEYALGTYPHEVARGYAAAYQEILARLLDEPDAPMDSLGLAEVLARVPGLAGGEAAGATPAVAADRASEEGGQGAAFTPVEETVAAIWTEVLGVPVESPHDDFFDLGGHSLLVGATIAEVRQQVSQSATLRMLFDYPQLREFVSQLEVDGRPA
ncbi:condensation domain-containing protein [Streptomyces sp. V2I9]|uniref:condensation domain-containing protein n=1 Tax=Streptomyces sp. V2I9 TaxID=3042304 RepID=UPI0027D7ACB6|nr:condensation domain-containing protein [Streptomyces sp. V2I9]